MFSMSGGIPTGMFAGMFGGGDLPSGMYSSGDSSPSGPGRGCKGGYGKDTGFKGAGGKGGMESEASVSPPPSVVNTTRYYELLGVSREATAQEVKKAYHKMAIKHHPDKGGDAERFQDIQQAFEVLNDPEKRRRYDERGEDGLDDDGPGSEGMFESLFRNGGMGGGRKQKQRTKDVVRPMWVTLEQLYTGITRQLPITRKVIDDTSADSQKTCEACNGRGMVSQVVRMGPMVQQLQQPCPTCRGAGKSAQMKTVPEVLDVFIEKGSPDGHKICLHGKADEAVDCESGDVVVVIKQKEHPRFLRRNADLYLEQEISLAEALTGFRLVVPHLDGRKLVVCSNPGEVTQPQQGGVALKAVVGGGMPIHSSPFKFGNLILVLSIRFPVSIEPSMVVDLKRLLGAPLEEEDVSTRSASKQSVASEVEQCFVTDLDPLEASQEQEQGGEAYEEDEDSGMPGMPGVQCKQQ